MNGQFLIRLEFFAFKLSPDCADQQETNNKELDASLAACNLFIFT